MTRFATALAGLAIATLTGPAVAATMAEAAGNWVHPDNGAIINFHDCGGDLCAKIVKPAKAGAKDVNNPDAAKREMPVEGLIILNHAKATANGAWKGDLYNAEDGKTYSGYVTLQAADKLQLKGCALVVFCKSVLFGKAPAP